MKHFLRRMFLNKRGGSTLEYIAILTAGLILALILYHIIDQDVEGLLSSKIESIFNGEEQHVGDTETTLSEDKPNNISELQPEEPQEKRTEKVKSGQENTDDSDDESEGLWEKAKKTPIIGSALEKGERYLQSDQFSDDLSDLGNDIGEGMIEASGVLDLWNFVTGVDAETGEIISGEERFKEPIIEGLKGLIFNRVKPLKIIESPYKIVKKKVCGCERFNELLEKHLDGKLNFRELNKKTKEEKLTKGGKEITEEDIKKEIEKGKERRKKEDKKVGYEYKIVKEVKGSKKFPPDQFPEGIAKDSGSIRERIDKKGKKQYEVKRANGTWRKITLSDKQAGNPSTKRVELHGEKQMVTIPHDPYGFPIFDRYSVQEETLPPSEWTRAQQTQFNYLNRQVTKKYHSNPKKFTMEFTEAMEKQGASKQVISKALQKIKDGEQPDNFTWHHHQEHGRMQLVPTEVNAKFKHIGGDAIWCRSK
ncbi:hypothetical protein GXN76_00635 [Kroppenstedtia pulmonis]|uniref:Pre-toxin TG domain-containing protein n=1 Tax=Kroppenstedtia pulmonis TaxID=1380685 RepID=A0A7D3XKM2_9BACL|nr:HNH endonuclease [Kroppenstedtia pulmonis]QKG83109.1 hypothetical protein GXN76_00635 [Kroppenstedtia pulmonis]